MKQLYGLIGKRLGHSFSKEYFTKKFEELGLTDYEYINVELDSISEFPDRYDELSLKGFNVTIPYKEAIIPYLSELDEAAEKIGAVNTVKLFSREGERILKGYNTDAFGFKQSIKPFLTSQHERALILGSGGASKAVKYVLESYGIQCLFVSRTPKEGQISWDDINENVIKWHKLVVNSTPIGMFPNVNEFPQIPYESLTTEHLLVDLVYNPEKTVFLQKGEANGAHILNGLSMLQQQAEEAWRFWES